jgi:hypothetical protein
MYNNWRVDADKAIKAIEKIKGNELKQIINGKIHTVEGNENGILILIDRKSGIDYIRENEFGLQGIAARIQFGDKAWNTFTIRQERFTGAKTEYDKRIEQIENGYFYPEFTMQGYLDQDFNVLSLAICRTKELYEYIRLYPEKIQKRKSDNCFLVVEWDDFSTKYKLKRFKKPI